MVFMTAPAIPRDALIPQERNIEILSTRSLGGGAITDLRMAPKSFNTARTTVRRSMKSASGRALKICRTTTSVRSTAKCHPVSSESADPTVDQSMRPTIRVIVTAQIPAMTRSATRRSHPGSRGFLSAWATDCVNAVVTPDAERRCPAIWDDCLSGSGSSSGTSAPFKAKSYRLVRLLQRAPGNGALVDVHVDSLGDTVTSVCQLLVAYVDVTWIT